MDMSVNYQIELYIHTTGPAQSQLSTQHIPLVSNALLIH